MYAGRFRLVLCCTHIVGTNGGWIHPGNKCCTTWRRDSDRGVHTRVAYTLAGEIIQVGGNGYGVAITSQVRTDIFANDAENVWLFGLFLPGSVTMCQR